MKRIIIVICVCLLSNCVVYWRQNHLSQLDTFPQKQLNAKINIVFDSFFEGNGINVSLDNIRIQQNAQLIQQLRASNLFADVGVSIKNPDYILYVEYYRDELNLTGFAGLTWGILPGYAHNEIMVLGKIKKKSGDKLVGNFSLHESYSECWQILLLLARPFTSYNSLLPDDIFVEMSDHIIFNTYNIIQDNIKKRNSVATKDILK